MGRPVLYGKDDCAECREARAALEALGVAHEFRSIEDMLKADDGWRHNGSLDLLAALCDSNGQLPIVELDGVYCTFREALEKLKAEARPSPISQDKAVQQA
ncbi:MAG: hypothetical protein FJ279_08070 [Planctomycetes bacterium]|nr:hypothetical protein [Planctomycetota bacterium]